ncbi:MAG: hypothetical protein H6R37_138 [Deltaproteobacteria bacterium]|nr:hypothetical protein [Deltaproteobacteria bacterium]
MIMMKKAGCMLVFAAMLLIPAKLLFAAVGCDLNDPDRDVARLFPGSTGYKTNYVSIDQKGGPALLAQVEDRLGDKFQGLFETIDVPYTLYEVFKGKEKIGYIHGVNEKGQYGGIQVFLVLDLDGVIKNLYFQKLTSRYGKELRDTKFGEQFAGLTLKDFYNYDVRTGKTSGPSAVEKIKNPVPEAEPDFRAALRGCKKNLILVDEFILGNKYVQYHRTGGEQKK